MNKCPLAADVLVLLVDPVGGSRPLVKNGGYIVALRSRLKYRVEDSERDEERERQKGHEKVHPPGNQVFVSRERKKYEGSAGNDDKLRAQQQSKKLRQTSLFLTTT